MSKFLAVGLGVAAVVLAGYIGVQLLGGPLDRRPARRDDLAGQVRRRASTPVNGSLPEGPHALSVNADGGLDITVSIPAPGWFGEPGENIVVKYETSNPGWRRDDRL